MLYIDVQIGGSVWQRQLLLLLERSIFIWYYPQTTVPGETKQLLFENSFVLFETTSECFVVMFSIVRTITTVMAIVILYQQRWVQLNHILIVKGVYSFNRIIQV